MTTSLFHQGGTVERRRREETDREGGWCWLRRGKGEAFAFVALQGMRDTEEKKETEKLERLRRHRLLIKITICGYDPRSGANLLPIRTVRETGKHATAVMVWAWNRTIWKDYGIYSHSNPVNLKLAHCIRNWNYGISRLLVIFHPAVAKADPMQLLISSSFLFPSPSCFILPTTPTL